METQEQMELISVREAAKIANVSYQTIWRGIHRGEIPAVRVGEEFGPLRINRYAFLAWLYGDDEAA
jgi:excisionase family DNA binding protein